MKLTDILSESFNPQEWEAKGYELPKYDLKAVTGAPVKARCRFFGR